MLIGTVAKASFVYSTRANSKTCVLSVSAPPFDPELGWSYCDLYSEKDLSSLVGRLVEFDVSERHIETMGRKHKFNCIDKYKPC